MSELSRITKLPEVKSAVLSDRAGGLLDAAGEADGESVAAVAGFLASSLAEAGEELGLGALRRIAFAGRSRACLLLAGGERLTMVSIEPPAAATAVERALDDLAQER